MPTALDELRKRLAEPPLPTELSINQVTSALFELGYELRVKGSHYQFRKSGAQRITIAVHKKRVGAAAVRELAELLRRQ